MKKILIKIAAALIFILLLWNCQKEDFLHPSENGTVITDKYQIERISSKDLKQDLDIAPVLKMISSRFRTALDRNLAGRSIVVGDGLVILDDEIARITAGDVITWTFKVETVTHETSDIENFMVKKYNDEFTYYLIKYVPSEETEQGYVALLEAINGEVLDISELDLSSRDAFDWENGNGGGTNDDCDGVLVYDHCNMGGNADGHDPELQLDEVTFCSGSPLLYIDFSHCENYGGQDNPTGDPVDGGSNPNDNDLSGGGSPPDDSGDGDNDPTVSTLVDPRCPPLDSGKIFVDGVCVCPVGYRENDEGKCILDDCNTSKEDLKKIFPNGSDQELSIFADLINNKGKGPGINTKEKLQHFLAQVGHETGGLNTLNITESTYWTTDWKLAKTYPNRFTMDSARANTNPNLYYAPDYLQNSQAVANIAMCCKFENGSVSSGDGWSYRGRGILQLTWKENYRRFKEWYNANHDPDLDFVTNPDLISSNDTLSILSGLWYFKVRVLNRTTIDGTTSVEKVTPFINSESKGINDRKQRFQVAKDSINCIN